MTDREHPGEEAVTLPADTEAAVRAVVEAGGAESVEQFVADAVSARLAERRRDTFHGKIMERRGGLPLSPEAIEWACRALGATPDQTTAMHAKLGDHSERAAS